jgi:hypothetical protein
MAFGKKVVLPFLMVLFSLAITISAQAASNWRSAWQVSANFIGNQPNVTLVVTVERQNSLGLWTLYGVNSVPLTCETTPGVMFAGDTAVFDGTGAIKCDMPSVQEIVHQMTNGRYTPDESCDCKGDPVILADVQLDPNVTGSVWKNPLVHRAAGTDVDMALAAAVPAFSTIPLASMEFTVDNIFAPSNPFMASAAPNVLAARYINLGAVLQPAFAANGADPGTAAPPVPALSVSYEATTLYIGYSPVTGESLHGTLHSLDVDPGCYGSG